MCYYVENAVCILYVGCVFSTSDSSDVRMLSKVRNLLILSGKRPILSGKRSILWKEAGFEWKEAKLASFAPRPLASCHVTIFRCAHKSLTFCCNLGYLDYFCIDVSRL